MLAILLGAAVGGAVLLTMPWALHIGGRTTPLLTWMGTGTLLTRGGVTYPLYLYIHPSGHAGHLRLDGLRASNGIGGGGCICLPGGKFQALNVSGTIYGAWRTTEGSVLELRLLEPIVSLGTPNQRGYFDLFGKWRGPELVLDDRGEWSTSFRSGLKIEHASAALHWRWFWTCKSVCASAQEQ